MRIALADVVQRLRLAGHRDLPRFAQIDAILALGLDPPQSRNSLEVRVGEGSDSAHVLFERREPGGVGWRFGGC